MNIIETLKDSAETLRTELDAVLTRAVDAARQLTPEEATDVDTRLAELKEAEARIAELEEVETRRANARRATSTASSAATMNRLGDDPLSRSLRFLDSERLVSDATREAAVQILERADSPAIAAQCAVLADPAYTSAFLKVTRDPVRGHMEFSGDEHAAFTRAADLQRSMSSGTNSAGGYMIPYILDPSIIITGAGTIDPMRRLATIKRVPVGNFHAISAAQVTAAWTNEGAVSPDNTPTLAPVTIPPYTARAFLGASFEAFQDIADLAQEVSKLFSDAKDNLESVAHMTSTGSGSPTGVSYAVGAVTASRVSPAVGGTLALADAFTVQNALPARYSRTASWVASITPINKLRQLAMAQNSANSIWTDMGAGNPASFLGRSFEEASAMSGSITTGQDVLLYGSFDRYIITDVIGSPTLEFIPNLFDTATGRPTGQRGFHLWWRTGAGVSDVAAFVQLRL